MKQSKLNEIELKMDANDQERFFEVQREKLLDALQKSVVIKIEKPTYPKAASIVASGIASNFYSPASLFHADLRRMISKAIEEDRGIALKHLEKLENEMGNV